GAYLPGEFRWIPCDCRGVVTRGDGLLENLPTDAAGRGEDRQLHASLHARRGRCEKAAACSIAHSAKVHAGRPSICSTVIDDGPGSWTRSARYPSSLSGTSSGRP